MLLSTDPPDGTTKFVDQIVRHAPGSIDFLYFSWRNALLGRYDVFHVHWPEALIRGRNQAVRAARAIFGMAFLVRLAVTRSPVVRTLHNIEPHESGPRYERYFARAIDRLTTATVRLNAATPQSPGTRDYLVLHGDYTEPFSVHPKAARVKGRVVYFGRIQPYKGLDRLIAAFRETNDADLTLKLVGKADIEVRRDIEERIGGDARISTDLRFVPDADLVAEVSAGSLAVFPYRQMHNSGALLVALSLGTPAVAPRSESNVLLQREVGEDWLRLYEGDFRTDILQESLAWAHTDRAESVPRFDPARSWGEVAASYASIYSDVSQNRNSRRG